MNTFYTCFVISAAFLTGWLFKIISNLYSVLCKIKKDKNNWWAKFPLNIYFKSIMHDNHIFMWSIIMDLARNFCICIMILSLLGCHNIPRYSDQEPLDVPENYQTVQSADHLEIKDSLLELFDDKQLNREQKISIRFLLLKSYGKTIRIWGVRMRNSRKRDLTLKNHAQDCFHHWPEMDLPVDRMLRGF